MDKESNKPVLVKQLCRCAIYGYSELHRSFYHHFPLCGRQRLFAEAKGDYYEGGTMYLNDQCSLSPCTFVISSVSCGCKLRNLVCFECHFINKIDCRTFESILNNLTKLDSDRMEIRQLRLVLTDMHQKICALFTLFGKYFHNLDQLCAHTLVTTLEVFF